MHPFLQKTGKKVYIKLHSELYNKNVFDEIKKEEPGYIKSIKKQNDYYLLDVAAKDKSEYLDFLNYLIYIERNK